MTVTHDDGWVDLCAAADVPQRGGRYVVHRGQGLAVFRVGGADDVRVMADACPHAGGSLSAGHVADGCVVCPRHGWAFDHDTGRCPDNPDWRLPTYPTRVRDGRVQIGPPPAE